MQDLFASPTAGRFGRRQKHERGARLPVTLVTGFLGAGKTTLVRHFLATAEGCGTAVIVNERGDTGIDDALLRETSEATTLIGNGCLCCRVRSDLETALLGLLTARERASVPAFRRVVVETSGLADPGPILATFATDRSLGGRFHLDGAVAVIGAGGGEAVLDRYVEARRQVLLADRIVVSKTDMAAPAAVDRLAARLGLANPRAAIVTATHGAVDPVWLTAPGLPASAFLAEEATHTDGVASFTLRDPEPIAWEPFSRALDLLIALRGADLLRLKGLLNVAGCRGPVVVQVVQHLAHPPVELAAWPDADRDSRLVVIARGLGAAAVRSLFAAARAVAGGRR
jgi:G3E family GTPase